MGIWAQAKEMGKQEMSRWCRDILRPNRVGLMLYTLPFSKKGVQETLASQKAFLDDCVDWDNALNGGEASPGTSGQPLQVPNGYGGWPPKFNAD